MIAELLSLVAEGLWLAVVLAVPVLVAVFIAGALTGLVAAVTQIQDPAVGMVPRVVAVALSLAMFAPTIARQLAAFGGQALALIASVGG